MNKILMLFLSFFLLTTIQTTSKDKFLAEVKNGYKAYEVVSNHDGDDYILCVVRGVNKNKASIGLYFYSVCEDEYYCTIDDDTDEYKVEPDKNKEIYYPAMSYTVNLTINVYNCDKELVDTVLVNRLYVASFVGEEGGNAGISFKGTKDNLPHSFIAIYIIGIGIIALSAIVIIIFKVNKKGMFSEDARKEGLEDLHHLEETYVNEELNEEDIYDVSNEEKEDTSHEQVYKRTRDYEEDLEEDRPSVKSVLTERGFNTDYTNMSVEDKNKVMVELMMMREQRIINNDEYQREIIELWKK